jgi:anti-sigma factor RsiW
MAIPLSGEVSDDVFAAAEAHMTRRDALEAYNRVTMPDALREMQLAPAETHQLPLHGATLSWRSYVVFGVIVAAVFIVGVS